MNRQDDLKAAIRAEVRARLAAMSEASQRELSLGALSRLQKQTVWLNAASVLMYAPLVGEVDLWPLLGQALAQGKMVALPRFDPLTRQYLAFRVRDPERDLELGRYGIREPVKDSEPVPLNRLDFLLVPGVAFDLHGRRLGRGKGYYDRLLANARGRACGVAFDEQIVDAVPVHPHDSDVNCILTPTRWIEL